MFKLLLVDDESNTRNGIYEYVDWNDFSITHVDLGENGVDALEKAHLNIPDILIADIKMPRMNGLELAQKVREINPSCSIIMMSAYTDKEYFHTAIEINVLKYVEKPIVMEELLSALYKAVEIQQDVLLNQEQIEKELGFQLTQKNGLTLRSRQVLDKYTKYFHTYNCLTVVFQRTEPHFHLELTLQMRTELKAMLRSENIQSIFLQLLDKRLVLHLGLESKTHHSHLYKMVEAMVSYLNHNFLNVYAGVGSPRKSWDMIYQSYEEALSASEGYFFKPSETVFYYEKINFFKKEIDKNDFEKFSVGIKEGSRELAVKVVEDIAEQIINSYGYNLQSTIGIFLEMYLELERNSIKQSSHKESEVSMVEKMNSAGTIVELKKLFLQELDAYFNTANANTSLVLQIQNIVAKQYMDSELSLKKICRQLYFSPTYICNNFKKETGITLSQFIYEYRIEKSLPYLRDHHTKVNDVAKQVGFNNSNYFTKIFKRVKSMSPTDYKERFSGEKNI